MPIGGGGFPGVGEKNVAVPLDAPTVGSDTSGGKREKISVKYTKAELKDAPDFNCRKAPARAPKH